MSDTELTSLLREHAAARAVPGAVLGVIAGGAAEIAATGVADVSTGAPVTPETRFAPGSLVKTMVATAISLEDPLARHVPELREVDWAERATLRDLLANRARVPLTSELEFTSSPDDDDGVLSRLAAAVAAQQAAAPVWSYTNVGLCLAGRVLETAAGVVWEEAMRTTLLEPLGLDETTFVTRPVAEPRASGHELTPDGPVPAEPWAPRALGPAGSTLLTTVTDVVRLAEAHLREPALAEMRVPHADVGIHGFIDRWCLGLAQLEWEGGPVWGWDGIISGQRAVLRLVPGRGAVALMTNGDNGRALYRSLFPSLMEERLGVRMPPLRLDPHPGAAGDLSRFAGVYEWPDTRYEVTPTEVGLVVSSGRETAEVLPIDQRTFVVDADDDDWPTLTFGALDESGRPGVLYPMLWGLPRRTA
jgi:CubicO group peptidase (beta-lactamase class C family)